MQKVMKFILYFSILCVLTNYVYAADTIVTDSKAQESDDPPEPTLPTVPPPTTEKPKPKVAVRDSELCKKCSCDLNTYVLDCSNKQWTNWFTESDWNTIQNGDITFTVVRLDHNNLTQIPQLPLNSIKSLYLGFNQISTIANAAFQNCSELEKLDLSHNKITSKVLKPDVFKGKYSPSDYLPLSKLVELDLGYNELHNLDADLFEHLPNLQTLILCENEFATIDTLTETAISGLTSLKTLDMSYMELSELPDNFLHGPRDLEVLILTGNLFKELPENLEKAVNLKQLVLDENPIGNLTGENIFSEIKNLVYLSVSYMNELEEIGPGAFSNLQNLKTLHLSANPKLRNIHVNAFAKNTSTADIFDYPPLKSLYLNNNKLTMLDRGMLQRWDKIEDIDLRYNSWSCDCSNHWLVNTLLPQIEKDKPLMVKDVQCAAPEKFKDISLSDLVLQVELEDCVRKETAGGGTVIWASLLVAVLVIIPIAIGGYVIYRRNGFRYFNRSDSRRAFYTRPMFDDDGHI